MGLAPSTLSYRGKLIAVKPGYGWGWHSSGSPELTAPSECASVPCPFHCRIQEFFYFRGELRGAVAVIEETGHTFDGFYTVFWNRNAGTHDFKENLPYCEIQIGVDTPVGEWPEFASGSPRTCGYGFVGETLKHIEENHARSCAV